MELNIFSGKCEFANVCRIYSKDSIVCNEEAGNYYGDGRAAGCVRTLRAQQEQAKKAIDAKV